MEMHNAVHHGADVEQRLLSTILEAVTSPPEAIRAQAVKVRVRVFNGGTRVAGPVMAGFPVDETETLSGWLCRHAGPGLTVRVEFLDGSGVAIPISGTEAKGSFPIPLPRPEPVVPNPAPAPEPLGVRTAPPPMGVIPGTVVEDAAAPLERTLPPSERSLPDAEATGRNALSGAELAATLQGAAAAVRLDQSIFHRLLDTMDRKDERLERVVGQNTTLALESMKLAGVTAGQIGHIAAPFAKAHADVASSLSGVSGKMVDATASNAQHAAELNGELLGDTRSAREAQRVAEVEAAKLGVGGEQPETDPAKVDPAKVIDSVTGLVKEGVAAVKSVGKDAARSAVIDLLGEVAGGADIPPEMVAALKRLSPEQRVMLGGKLGAALQP